MIQVTSSKTWSKEVGLGKTTLVCCTRVGIFETIDYVSQSSHKKLLQIKE
jgi:hypothetical protein